MAIESVERSLPSGHLLLREEGRFIGELNLPNLNPGDIHSMIYGYDPDVLYRRKVTRIENEENSDAIIYNVEYKFENRKISSDVYSYFCESFYSLKDFQITNITASDPDEHMKYLRAGEALLDEEFIIPHQSNQTTINYQIVINKAKKQVTSEDNDNTDS